MRFHACEGHSIAVVVMRDRRTPNQRQEKWLLQNSVERQLFGSSGTGAYGGSFMRRSETVQVLGAARPT